MVDKCTTNNKEEILSCHLTCVDGKSRTRTQGSPTRHTTYFYQQTFAKAVGVAAATIAQASVAGGQGGPSDLQKFMAHHPPTCMGGGDSADRSALAIGVDDMRSIRDLGASAKRKESQPSF